MAYFPNGTSGMIYEEEYCDKCVHGQEGCHVWLVHLGFDYCKDSNADILDTLIPMNKGTGFAEKCTMFHELRI